MRSRNRGLHTPTVIVDTHMDATASIVCLRATDRLFRTKEKRNEYKAFRVSGKVNVFADKTYASFCVSCDENQSLFSDSLRVWDLSRWSWFKVNKSLRKKENQDECSSISIPPTKKQFVIRKFRRIVRKHIEYKRKIPLINICVVCQFGWDKNNHSGYRFCEHEKDFTPRVILCVINLDYLE